MVADKLVVVDKLTVDTLVVAYNSVAHKDFVEDIQEAVDINLKMVVELVVELVVEMVVE